MSEVAVNRPHVCGVATPRPQAALEHQLQVADPQPRVFPEVRCQLPRRRIRINCALHLLHDPETPISIHRPTSSSHPPHPGWCTGCIPVCRRTHSPFSTLAAVAHSPSTSPAPKRSGTSSRRSIPVRTPPRRARHKPTAQPGASDTPEGSVIVSDLTAASPTRAGWRSAGTFKSTAIPDASSPRGRFRLHRHRRREMQLFTTRQPRRRAPTCSSTPYR